MKYLLCLLASLSLAAVLPGCESNIRPLRPVERVELWVPDDGSAPITLAKTPIEPPHPAMATPESSEVPADVHPVDVTTMPTTTASAAPATLPSTAPATQVAATEPAATQDSALTTQNSQLPPGHKMVRIHDPNQTARYVYNATYDNIWQQAMMLIHQTGFALDRQDYRLGVLTTKSLPSSQFVEFWKPQQTDATNAMENTVNCQRRYLRLTISPAPKPNFYEIGIQVLVERETNPTEALSGPLFIEGSGFGRNAVSLRSDYTDPNLVAPMSKTRRSARFGRDATVIGAPPPAPWVILGHDPKLEQKLLDQLFQRI